MLGIRSTIIRLQKLFYVLLLIRVDDFAETARVQNYRSSYENTPSPSKVWPTSSLRELEPSFVGPIENVTGALGREAVLTCSISDIGDYKVAWIRADDQTILTLHTRLVTHSPRYAVTNDSPDSWQLHIRPLKVADRGCYMCQINTNTMKKQVGCIDVLVPPNIMDEGTSSDIIVQEGSDVVITCKADGRPEPRILWRREDGTNIELRNEAGILSKVDTYLGTSLNLSKVDRIQMGAYLCIASNDVPPSVSKRIMLTVNFAPTIKIKSKIIKVTTGAQANLECFTEANPSPNIYWLKSGEETIISGEKYEMFEERLSVYQMRSKLIVRRFTTEDSGTYTCFSSNTFGKADGTMRLYEIKTTTTTTTTSTTTTTTTTTEAARTKLTILPSTPEYTSLSHLMVPIQPAQHKYFNPEATYGTMQNVIDQSILDTSWLPTAESTSSKGHRNTPIPINALIYNLPHILYKMYYYIIVILVFIASNNTVKILQGTR